jgi:hypothetical protein
VCAFCVMFCLDRVAAIAVWVESRSGREKWERMLTSFVDFEPRWNCKPSMLLLAVTRVDRRDGRRRCLYMHDLERGRLICTHLPVATLHIDMYADNANSITAWIASSGPIADYSRGPYRGLFSILTPARSLIRSLCFA